MLTDSAIIMEDLEMDELITIAVKGIILLKALNSLSPQSFFFFNSALLGFPNKSVKMS
jgi:hypothetical protein